MNDLQLEGGVIALAGFWLRDSTTDSLHLLTIPEEKQTYYISFDRGPKITLGEAIWINYRPVLAYYNGFDTVEDIENVRFCFGTVEEIISTTENGTVIRFLTNSVLAFDNIIFNNASIPFPEEWEGVYHHTACENSNSSLISIIQIGHYWVASFGLGQGTYSQNIIIIKRGNKYYCPIVKDNYSSDYELVYCKNYEISEKLVNLLIEEMGVRYKVFLDDKIYFKLKSAAWFEEEGLIGWRNEIFIDILSRIREGRKIEVANTNGGHHLKFAGTEEFCEWVREVYDPTFSWRY